VRSRSANFDARPSLPLRHAPPCHWYSRFAIAVTIPAQGDLVLEIPPRGIRLQARAARASSDPVTRLFISSICPNLMENSRPRCMRRSSPPPGMTAVSSRFQGTTLVLQASSAAHGAGLQAVQEALELADEPQEVNQAGMAE
jgi:hypothetical protein